MCVPNLSFMIILFWERYLLATMHFLIYSRLSFFTRECTWLAQGVVFPNISIQPMVGQQIALTTPLSGQICHVCAPSPSPAFCFQALHLPPASQERKQIYFPSANLFHTKCLAHIFPVLQPLQPFLHPKTWEIHCLSQRAPGLDALSLCPSCRASPSAGVVVAGACPSPSSGLRVEAEGDVLGEGCFPLPRPSPSEALIRQKSALCSATGCFFVLAIERALTMEKAT